MEESMNKNTVFAVIGGDLRQAYLATLIKRDGFPVHTYAMELAQVSDEVTPADSLEEALKTADCVVLPLPCLSDGELINTPLSTKNIQIQKVISEVKKGAVVLAGRVDPQVYDLASRAGVHLIDYFQREELAVLNAVPTAEGAIQLAMEELPITLHGSSCLIIGFGRIGKVLAAFLHGLGVRVTVAVRKYSDMAWLSAYGYHAAETGKLWQCLDRFDLIFNTVPARLLNEQELRCLKRDCLCIDLASKPGGIDLTAAQQLGIRCIWALSLPGKVAPFTSGEIILDTIYNILEERRDKG
jgi:dipicolinate synthase subunit A